jgi:hypothetical protein
VTGTFKPPATRRALRARPLAVLARPWTERRFLHRDYARLLDRLAGGDFHVVPLRELREAPADRPVVALRHDVEERFASALELADLERDRGLRATYFVLHTAPYYKRSLLPGLRLLQEMGHEVGWHNDLVTLQCVKGVPPREYLRRELAWLRENGIDVRGTSSHGSYWTHRLRYHNKYFFSDFEDEVEDGFANSEVIEAGTRRCVLEKGSLAEFGLEYEAYHLGEDRYFSDARFDDRGRRFHTDAVDLDALRPGERAIVLTHPDYWDPSVARKALRTAVWSARRLVAGERRWRLPS